MSKAQLDAMAQEATIDCYNEAEQLTGFLTMIDGNLAVPFETRVLGMSVVVESVDQTEDGQIVALCRRGEHRQSIPILDLPLLPTPGRGRSESMPTATGWAESKPDMGDHGG